MSAGLQNAQRGDGWYVCSFRDFSLFDNLLRLQFWSTSIVDAAVQVLGLFYLRESQFDGGRFWRAFLITFSLAFSPFLLERKAEKIRRLMDVEKAPHREVRTIFDEKQDRS